MLLSSAICLTLLASSAAAAEVHFALVDPKEASSDFYYNELMKSPHNNTTDVVWITGSGETLLDAWNDAANNSGYTYEMSGNSMYPNQLSTINGPFTNYEGWGNNGSGFVWWKTYVCDGSNLSTWDNSLSQTGVVLADHSASEYPYFAFVWGCWATWPYPDGISGSPYTVLPSDCPLAPVANFTSDVTSGTAPLEVQFNDSSTGSPTSYAWDFDNDGTVDSEEQSPSFTYDSAGTYTVNLTVSNAGGSDSEVKTDYISVSESLPSAPVSNFTATPTSGDAPLTVQFTDASTGTVSSYAWDFDNDGTVDSEEQSPSYTYYSAGSYSVNLTVSNAAGSDSELKTEYIVVEPVVIVEPSEVKFVLVDPANGTSEWINGSGVTLLDAWNDTATRYGYTYAIGGNSAYPGQLSTINGPFTGYEGWGNNGTGMTWWKTYVSDGSNLSTWNIDYSQTGIVLADHQASEFPYFAFVWGQWTTWPNPWGMGTDFTVLPSDCPLVDPVANFTANVTSGTAPLAVQFNDSSTGSPTSWQWDFDNDGAVDSTEQNPIYTYSTAGTYAVNLTVSNSVGSDSEVKTEYISVLLSSAPVANFTATPTYGYAPLTVQFTDASSGDISSYAWDLDNDGVVDNTTRNPLYTYSAAGAYTVNLTVIGPDGSDSEVKTDYIIVHGTGTSGLAETPCPKFQVDPYNTGQSQYAGPETNNTVWTYTTEDSVQYSGPSIGADGTIYIGSADDNIYALNPDGTLKWKYTTGGDVCGSPAIAADGTIYCGSSQIYALNPDGTLKWNYTTEGRVLGSPVIGSDGTIYCGCADIKKLYALNPDGTLKWSYTIGDNVYYCTPAIGSDGTIYFDSSKKTVYALNPDGTLKWTYTTEGLIQGGPAIGVDGTIYIGTVGTTTPNVYALNPDGTLKWNYKTGFSIYTSPAIGVDGTIYIGDGIGNFHALNPDGTLKWSKKIGTKFYRSAPAIGVDGTIYVGNGDKNVYAINSDGTIKWSYTTGSNVYCTPAIGSDGTLYIGSSDKKIYAFKDVPPVADFAADITNGTAPLAVQFNDKSTGSPTSYSWDFDNDGTVDSEEKNPSYTYESAGTYTVNLTVSNALGNDSEVKTEYITVEPGEAGDAVKFLIQYQNGTTQWIKGGQSGDTILQAWDDAATYYGIVYTLDNRTNYPNNLASIFGVGPEGQSWWKVYVNDGSNLSKWNSSYSMSSYDLTNHTASEHPYVSFVYGNWQTSPSVYPSDCPFYIPVTEFSANQTAGTMPLSVEFTDKSTGSPTSWQWDFNNDGIVDSAEQNPIYTYASAGTYAVNLTVSNAVGSDSEVKTDYITVSESSTPEPEPVAEFTADVTSGTAPLTVNFTDQSTESPTSWAWDFENDGVVDSTEQNPSYTYESAGNYTVNLTVANTAGSDSEVKTDYITVSESSTPVELVAAFTADVTGGTAPLTVNFTDLSTGTPTSWFWDFGDGANSTEQNPSHTYSAAGNYTVNLTVENDAGSDFELKSDYIEVSEASGSTVTLYFDPESSSVSENESTEISIIASNFPAGLSGYNLTVDIDDPSIAEIVDIEYPTWALITQNSTLPATSIYMKTVDLEDSIKEGAADVVLATLTVSGKEKGSANLSIGVKRLEEDSGDSIEPALLAGTIEVTLLSPLPDQEYAPKDLDGDGLYEDLTGNGEFSFVDIVAYFHNMDWIEENMPVEYFDFNGNGRIDFDDVVDMFAMI
ncbi:cell surface protein [Methanosarcina siciliae C2J]|uniref:Cell surface protein n=1 Tax=Methanosarcina siciliae C2J TaxID=1434118 RepID=A0A0E3PR82_9EURY|nr:PKD domain-containing protein [Methanosarcina siciliae]AKB37165.1 cell surface protein [Methanosarcina siciliae C2J]